MFLWQPLASSVTVPLPAKEGRVWARALQRPLLVASLVNCTRCYFLIGAADAQAASA